MGIESIKAINTSSRPISNKLDKGGINPKGTISYREKDKGDNSSITPKHDDTLSSEIEKDNEFSTVFSLNNSDINISFSDKIGSVLPKDKSENIQILRDDTVLQYCNVDPKYLDKNDKGIFLIAVLGNNPIPMLIDTGASCCVMSRSIYESIPKDIRPTLTYRKCGIRSVSGELMKCHGVTTLGIKFNETEVPVEFHVAEVCDKVILGMSFLTDFGVKIDAKNGTLSIGDDYAPCMVLDGNPSPKRVYLTSEFTVPAGSEMILPGKAHYAKNKTTSNTTASMIFEPKPSFFGKHGLVACSTTTMNNSKTVPIRVFNPTDKDVTVSPDKNGMRCGYLTPTKDVTEVISKADIVAQVGIDLGSVCSEGTLPDHLKQVFEEACENLTAEEQLAVKEKLIQYQDVFSKGENDLGRTHLTEHKIVTKTDTPVKQRLRPLPPKQSEEVERQVKLLLESGMISPSDSAWCSPVVCVTKKDGSMRMCCDYRKLNEVTVKDAHPIPPINESIDALSGSKFFCSLDLISGYHQVPIHPDSRDKTAFCTKTGLYAWNCMGFGLTNSPATFQRLMNRILKGLHWSICMCYLDDILVFGPTFEEVLKRLEVILIRLREAGLKLKPKKCKLFKTEILYLGFKISQNGVHTDPAKIKDVEQFPKPVNVQGVRRFLGLTNYYRKFINGYAKLAYPLNRLLDKPDKKEEFQWTEKCENAFNVLKQKLVTAPILALPREKGMYFLDTDSSAEGLGAVLQQMQDDKLVVIAYSSKSLSAAERNYCVTRQELLSIVYHINHFRCYLWGNHFKVRTDHASLKYLISFRDANGQLARWIDSLSEYDYEIISRPGKLNGNADSLSRIPCGGKKCMCNYSCSDPTLEEFHEKPCPLRQAYHVDLEEDLSCEDISLNALFACNLREVTVDPLNPMEKKCKDETSSKYPFPWTELSLIEAQQNDSTLKPVIDWLKLGSKPPWKDVSQFGEEVKTLLASWKSLVLQNGLLLRRNIDSNSQEVTYQIVIPRAYQKPLLYQYHDSITAGHLGVAKVYNKIQKKYFWSKMKCDIELYVKTCISCQRKKHPPRSFCAPLQKYVVGVPFERVALDVMGPLNETDRGNLYILVVTDYFTRWVEAYPMPNQKAETVARVLSKEWISRYGCMSEIHSDNGTNFESEVFHGLCDLLGIDKTSTCVRRPQSDGVCERFNHTVQTMLATAIMNNVWDWDEILPYLMMAYRNSRHESLGISPAKMLYGKEITLPLEAFIPDPNKRHFNAPEYIRYIRDLLQHSHEIARENLQKAVEYQNRSYLNRLKYNCYSLRDAVWYWQPVFKKGQCPKLLSFWSGPYYIVEVLSDVVFRIQQTAKCKSKVVHYNHLKPCYLREKEPLPWLDNCIEKYAKRLTEAKKEIPLADLIEPKEQPIPRPTRIKRAPDRFDKRIKDPDLK